MTVFDDMSTSASAAVNRWLVKQYREAGDNDHLRRCDGLALDEVDGRDSTYGCQTGCEYARLEAAASCPHGQRDDFEYGQFGDLSRVLNSILVDEGEVEAQRSTRPVFQVTGSPTVPTGVWTRLLGTGYEVLHNAGANVPLHWTVTRVATESETLAVQAGDGVRCEVFTVWYGNDMGHSVVGSLAVPVADGRPVLLHYRAEVGVS